MARRFLLLLTFAVLFGIGGLFIGLTQEQAFIVFVFSLSIFGTLFFWDFRLSFVFLGSGILFLTRSIDLDQFLRYSSLDVIIFLIGMMIIVGMMKEAGVFRWLVAAILRMKNLNGWKLFAVLMALSAILSALMGEVTSIMVMMAIILEICGLLKLNPVPLVISSVLSTNVGSSSTLLGNPIGVLIALRGKFSFEDFLTHALPLSVIVLAVTVLFISIWYRRYLKDLSSLLALRKTGGMLTHSFSADTGTKVSILIFAATIVSLALHKRIEMLFGLEDNELLVVLPVIFAGIAMAYRYDRAKYYIEREVEWTSLLFFLFLFAQTGAIQASGIAQSLAEKLVKTIGAHPLALSGATLFSSGILSSVLDNTVVVASYIPIVQSLQALNLNLKPLWWCILFGACYGGNITAIGSTANIVALGILEKEKNLKIDFIEWLKIGLVVGMLTMAISYLAIISMPVFYR